MPREPKAYTTDLAKYCRRNSISITQLGKSAGIAYKTSWCAFHGYRVSFDIAEKIHVYTKGIVSIESLCSGPPRPDKKVSGS